MEEISRQVYELQFGGKKKSDDKQDVKDVKESIKIEESYKPGKIETNDKTEIINKTDKTDKKGGKSHKKDDSDNSDSGDDSDKSNKSDKSSESDSSDSDNEKKKKKKKKTKGKKKDSDDESSDSDDEYKPMKLSSSRGISYIDNVPQDMLILQQSKQQPQTQPQQIQQVGQKTMEMTPQQVANFMTGGNGGHEMTMPYTTNTGEVRIKVSAPLGTGEHEFVDKGVSAFGGNVTKRNYNLANANEVIQSIFN